MALQSDAAMLLYCDFDGDPVEHDEWHTYEHLHERLSIPGFLRGTRWVALSGEPKYFMLYELDSVEVARSPDYLARLNDPSPWTAAIMPRLSRMIRGFSRVTGGMGYGLGAFAFSMRFRPERASQTAAREWMHGDVLPRFASLRGIAGVSLLEPVERPPMTKEQALRGRDEELGWVLFATAYDAEALQSGAALCLRAPPVGDIGAQQGYYRLHCTVTAGEVARTPANPPRTRPRD